MASEAWKHELLAQPDVFLVTYFPKIRPLKDFHLELLDTATTERKSLILFPAAHGKTTLISTLLPIWALCKDPNIRMAIITKNSQDAKGIMQSIQAELLGNEDLIRDFGPFKGEDKNQPFGLERLSVVKRTLRAKEPTIAAFGSGAKSALGHRSDWTICDDIVTEKNSNTPEQREKLRMWFNQGPQTMADEVDVARLTVVGTLFDPEDLYADLMDLTRPDTGDPIYTVVRKQAIPDPDTEQVLWPERRPWLWLMEQKASMGTLDFNKRYNNIAVDKSRMVFREEYIYGLYVGKDKYPGCLDKRYHVGDFDPNWRKAGGFDPAIGVTKTRKFCAHMSLGVGSCAEHETCYWVIDCLREQLTLPQQVETLLERHEKYGLDRTAIETNSYQAGLLDAVKQRMDERGLAMRFEPHYTTKANKPDPELGVQSMGPWFEQGKVHIPWADNYSQKRMRQFVDELLMYPGKYTDTVMAFWFAWRKLQTSAPRYQSSNYLKRPMQWGTGPGRRKVRNPYYVDRSVA